MFEKNLIYLPTCQSTNTHLACLSQEKHLPEGSIVYTFEQTAGRGQRGNTWESEPHKNLTFSLLLYPHFVALPEMFALSMATALGVYDFLMPYLPTHHLKIKYPNDLLVGEKKIGGILIENSLRGEHIEKSIIGIGLNINQLEFSNLRATSLLQNAPLPENTAVYNLFDCLQNLLNCLAKRYEMLKQQKLSEIKANFLAKSFRFNELCVYFTEAGEIHGKIIDIDFSGNVHLLTEIGTQKFHFKEIAFFPPPSVID
jgi:BirA family biotin operon repressor/biotin-[acetyl-CoA-carboxylase] ligase